MKNLSYYFKSLFVFLVVLQLSLFSLFAQAPQKMSYQSVIRDAGGLLVTNSAVGIKISILQGSATGTVKYAETHATTTNANGLATIEIGAGTQLSTDSFVNINWANGPFYIKTETDPVGGTNYILSATSQLLSVPYALYANNGMRNGNNAGDMLYWNGTQWVTVTGGTQGQTLTFCNGVPTWGPCMGLATVSTSNASSTGSFSGSVMGTVSASGGSTVTSRGICYSTTPNPTLANSFVANGGGLGLYNCSLTGLTSNTLYYVRAYATNSTGTAYGNQESFTTGTANLATLTTKPASLISHTSARSGGIISNAGGTTITASGICYATTPNPTLANTVVSSGSSGNTGALNFVNDMMHLSPNTTYYVRAYATNGSGTAYGNEISFATPATNTLAILTYPDTILSGSSVVYFSNVSYLYPTKLVYPNLKKVTSTSGIYFSGNNNIVAVDFPVLDTIDGYLYIDNNLGLANFNAPSLKTVKRYVYVRRNTSLQQLSICNMTHIYCDGQNPYYSISGNTGAVDSNLTCYAAALQTASITTNAITQFSNNTAVAGAVITKSCQNSSFVGVCYSTSPNPTVNNAVAGFGGVPPGSTQPLTANMNGLLPNTTYYVRAYISTSVPGSPSGSTVYGNEVSFTTLP